MHKFIFCVSLSILTCLLLGCSDDIDIDIPVVNSQSSNILLIIADDIGKEAISGYSEGEIKPYTPNINALRSSGVTFNNLWVYPTCSPTRSSIITGKYGYRTGVKWAGDALDDSEIILQKYINTETNNKYATAVIGKWHLAGNENADFNPEYLGIDYFSGILSGGVQNYNQWRLIENAASSMQNDYITEKFTDLSINWINDQDKPWFLWLAYTAPHTPFHAPPVHMHNQGVLAEYSSGDEPLPYFLAAIEALDFQIGRLIENIPDEQLKNTTIIFISDNGSPTQVAQSPFSNNKAKGTLNQGGINTPMFISGAQVSRRDTDDNLINGTDLFSTISELAGIQITKVNDSESFKSLLTSKSSIRDYQYSELDNGTKNQWAIRNKQFKLIQNINGNELFYDLISDPYEELNLLNNPLSDIQAQAKIDLEKELALIRN